MTPALRKRLIELGQRHMLLADHSIVPDDVAAADADRSYVGRAAENRDYHLAAAAALRAYLKDQDNANA